MNLVEPKFKYFDILSTLEIMVHWLPEVLYLQGREITFKELSVYSQFNDPLKLQAMYSSDLVHIEKLP